MKGDFTEHSQSHKKILWISYKEEAILLNSSAL